MSTRLNATIREGIVSNALIKAGIEAEQAAYDADHRAWVEDLRVHANGATDSELLAMEQKALKAVRAFPKQMLYAEPTLLDRSHYFTANLAGANLHLSIYNAAGDGHESRIVPRQRVNVTAENPLVQRFYDLEARKEMLKGKRAQLTAQVRAVIKSVPTVKRLLLVWPESKELLPTNVDEAKSQLPALAVVDLNAMIGLPTEEAA